MSGILLASVGNSYGSLPVNTVAPVVSGTATVGQTLSTTDGTWTGAPTPTFTYQWQRNGVNISGATSSTYVLQPADYDNPIRCVVTATNPLGTASANSNQTANVAGVAPSNTSIPVITGSPAVGETLSSSDGTWTGTPTPTFTYQWQRNSVNISGATSSTYTVVAGDVGNPLRCVVTATNIIGSSSANSNQTANVGTLPVNTVAPVVSGTAKVGQTLSTTNGTWTGTPTPTFTYQWQRNSVNISGATGSTYVLQPADYDNPIRCVVTATNTAGAVSANSNQTANVTADPYTAIGQAIEGGFWAGDISLTADGVATHHLIVAPVATGQSIGIAWKNTQTTTPGADSTIDGPQNTADMVADGNSTVYPAAHFCNDLTIGGYSDWYMPAKNEVEVCYFNLKPTTFNNNTSSGINPNSTRTTRPRTSNYSSSTPKQTIATAFKEGGAQAFRSFVGPSGDYWTSTESSFISAQQQSFRDGQQDTSQKNSTTTNVRAVRRVAV